VENLSLNGYGRQLKYDCHGFLTSWVWQV